MRIAIAGGGAAGFFAAITCAENFPGSEITIFERAPKVLAKVLISGGGRCNVTNACFDPKVLIQSYPRGSSELLGPFYRFQPKDIMEWFENRGIPLKTEPDGRVFPVTDKSQTIVDALIHAARSAGIQVRAGVTLSAIEHAQPSQFSLTVSGGEKISFDRVLLATGSGPQGYDWARSLGHTLESPVPSLFTFTIEDHRLKDLSGVAVEKAEVTIEESSLRQIGPVLITHWGLSGPAILKLSAWGARILHERAYKARLRINWLGLKEKEIQEALRIHRAAHSGQSISAHFSFDLPRRLWARLVASAGIDPLHRWGQLSNVQEARLLQELGAGVYEIQGKGVFKEEFVTAGGVRLSEVNFKTMESKICPGLYFAGEILDIDGVTGGFNFQSAWTTGFLAGSAMGSVS